MPDNRDNRKVVATRRVEYSQRKLNLEGSWRYKVTVLRRSNELEAPDFNNLVTAETDGVINQEGEFLYLELPPDQTRPIPGILLGIVSKQNTNLNEKIRLDFVDHDDNGIFALTDTKIDSNGYIVELKGTYREPGFAGQPVTQLQTIGSVTLTKIIS